MQAGPVKLSGLLGWLGWGFIHIAFLTGVQNRVSTVATWLSTIARARRTDRTFMLGSPTNYEQPYTWSACGPAVPHRALEAAAPPPDLETSPGPGT